MGPCVLSLLQNTTEYCSWESCIRRALEIQGQGIQTNECAKEKRALSLNVPKRCSKLAKTCAFDDDKSRRKMFRPFHAFVSQVLYPNAKKKSKSDYNEKYL